MNLLISNDDGINAPGIQVMVKSLCPEANIYVCAPDTQRSASGHGISVAQLLDINEVPFEGAKLALSISGTPADSVKLGIAFLNKHGIDIDMVFSGINHGGNLGTDTLYSGTVSAAIEGCICGKPSVAISVNSHMVKDFSIAGEMAFKALKKCYGKLDNRTVININVPDLPRNLIRGVKYTRLGLREYDNWFIPQQCDDGKIRYRYGGDPVVYEGLPGNIDVMAMQEGFITITPLHYDLTNHGLIEEVQSWRIEE